MLVPWRYHIQSLSSEDMNGLVTDVMSSTVRDLVVVGSVDVEKFGCAYILYIYIC